MYTTRTYPLIINSNQTFCVCVCMCYLNIMYEKTLTCIFSFFFAEDVQTFSVPYSKKLFSFNRLHNTLNMPTIDNTTLTGWLYVEVSTMQQ